MLVSKELGIFFLTLQYRNVDTDCGRRRSRGCGACPDESGRRKRDGQPNFASSGRARFFSGDRRVNVRRYADKHRIA